LPDVKYFEYLRPRPLRSGDAILLAAPARWASEEVIQSAVASVEAAGFRAVIPEGLDARDGQFGGSDTHRAEILNGGFRRGDVRAIWALRGGYGCARLLPLLEAAAFRADPTWIVGFSDITALHLWAQAQGVASLHAPVASTFQSSLKADRDSMWTKLTESDFTDARRPVLGGNLSVLYSLLGTPDLPDFRGAWLLLEDLDEYLYHIDRMFCALRLAGILDAVHGLMLGSFTDLHDNTIASGQTHDNPFGRDLPAIVKDHLPGGKPVVWDVPVGHGARNAAVVMGGGDEWGWSGTGTP
jgi:muramoyltetrapeptide carboxypeptidase